MSSDDVDWQRVVNSWPPLWMFDPIISGDTILIPSATESTSGESTYLDWIGHINESERPARRAPAGLSLILVRNRPLVGA